MPFDFQRDGVCAQCGGGFVDHDLDRGDFLERETESGNRFRQSFQEPEGGAFHKGNHFFFDFTVNSAYLTKDYEGYTPAEGNALLVADITVKNTNQKSIEMYDTDFQIQWDDGDDAFAYPITINTETYEELDPVGDSQLPGTYTLAVDEERTGELVYEVPAGFTDFSIAYLEQFVDEDGNESTGDTFFVYFTAEDQTGVSA